MSILSLSITAGSIVQMRANHQGLWLAEYELKSPRAKLPPLQAWVGSLSGESRYTNAALAMKS